MSGIAKPCPNVEAHTWRPEGFMQWVDWAERMSKTHKQTKCPECGLWAIWIKKPRKIIPGAVSKSRGALRVNSRFKSGDRGQP